MRYELQKYYENPLFPEKSVWDSQQFFHDTEQGLEDALTELKRQRSLDKRHPARLVFTERTPLNY